MFVVLFVESVFVVLICLLTAFVCVFAYVFVHECELFVNCCCLRWFISFVCCSLLYVWIFVYFVFVYLSSFLNCFELFCRFCFRVFFLVFSVCFCSISGAVDVFSAFPYCESMCRGLSNNQITSIANGLFTGLTSLQQLWVWLRCLWCCFKVCFLSWFSCTLHLFVCLCLLVEECCLCVCVIFFRVCCLLVFSLSILYLYMYLLLFCLFVLWFLFCVWFQYVSLPFLFLPRWMYILHFLTGNQCVDPWTATKSHSLEMEHSPLQQLWVLFRCLCCCFKALCVCCLDLLAQGICLGVCVCGVMWYVQDGLSFC